MNINIVSDIPIDEIQYGKLEFDSGSNCYKSKLQFKGQKLCVETPTLLFYELKKMSTKHKHHRVVLAFKNDPDNQSFYEWFRKLEMKHTQYLLSSEVFTENMDLDADFDLLFESDIVPSMRLNELNQINVYLPVVNNEISVPIHDSNNKSIPVTDIVQGFPVKLVLCCEYVCFEPEKFYARWMIDELSVLGTVAEGNQEVFKDEIDEVIPVSPVKPMNDVPVVNDEIDVLTSNVKDDKKNDMVVMSNPLFIKNMFNENESMEQHGGRLVKSAKARKEKAIKPKKNKSEKAKKKKRKLKDIIQLKSDKSITTLK